MNCLATIIQSLRDNKHSGQHPQNRIFRLSADTEDDDRGAAQNLLNPVQELDADKMLIVLCQVRF